MNAFGDLVSKLKGGTAAGEGSGGMVASVVQMLSSQKGGISGLVEMFQQKGLGDVVSSWIGTGANRPVSPEQVQEVLGREQIQAFAQKAGIAPEAASSKLAEVLPDVVDKLTPDGQVPQGDDLMSRASGLLEGLFSKPKTAP